MKPLERPWASALLTQASLVESDRVNPRVASQRNGSDKGYDMNTVASTDGSKIGYDTIGHGPAVILVAGALCSRSFWSGPELAKLLAPRFTVYNYDRRGRGDSGDTKPYAVEREVEDIKALIDEAGGAGYPYGPFSRAAPSPSNGLKVRNIIQ